MEQTRIVKIQSSADLEKCYPIMKELRKDLSLPDFLELYNKAHQHNSYEIIAIEKDGALLSVMGYRILYDFVHGKHLYIDDLVSSETHRSKGLGTLLIKHAEELAKEMGCRGLRLCTGIENESAKKFYERNLWNLRAVVYKKKIKV
jgi:ribosomal protein S18 acetylase RimI-like enzyme